MRFISLTDEVTDDLPGVMCLGEELSLDGWGLRTLFGKRFPNYDEDDLTALDAFSYNKRISDALVLSNRTGAEYLSWDVLKQSGFNEIFELCERIGIETLTIMCDLPCETEQEYRKMYEQIRKFCQWAYKRDIKVLLKNAQHSLCKTADNLITALEAIGAENLYISWDPLVSFCSGCALKKEFTELQPYLRAVHIKDVIETDIGYTFVKPCSGSLGIKPLANLMQKNGYDQTIIIEPGLNNRQDFIQAAKTIIKMFK